MKTKSYFAGQDASVIDTASGDGKHRAIGINLRVLIQPDGNFWYAQGLEIDYGAQGSSIDEAKEHFQKGLSGTVKLHLQKHGHVEKLLKRVDEDTWNQALADNANVESFMQVSFHSIDAANAARFPYPMVEFYRPKAA